MILNNLVNPNYKHYYIAEKKKIFPIFGLDFVIVIFIISLYFQQYMVVVKPNKI